MAADIYCLQSSSAQVHESIPALQQSVQSRYQRMSAALNATGRPILFSMCEWGVSSPWLYAQTVSSCPEPMYQAGLQASCAAHLASAGFAGTLHRPTLHMKPFPCMKWLGNLTAAIAWLPPQTCGRCKTHALQVANTWRTTQDISLAIQATWGTVMDNLDGTTALARYAGPGAWNDADMLEVHTTTFLYPLSLPGAAGFWH
jgi:hypothetical protein